MDNACEEEETTTEQMQWFNRTVPNFENYFFIMKSVSVENFSIYLIHTKLNRFYMVEQNIVHYTA